MTNKVHMDVSDSIEDLLLQGICTCTCPTHSSTSHEDEESIAAQIRRDFKVELYTSACDVMADQR